MELPIANRAVAGEALAEALVGSLQGRHLVVLALPRGGVPVAAPVAERLHAPLDLMLVRKLGFPGQEEYAMGALATGGVQVMNEPMLERHPVPRADMDRVTQKELAELERRERAYRGDRPPPPIKGQEVILVDDGLATGATMLAAVRACQKQGAATVRVAVPVGPQETVRRLLQDADDVICLATPERFGSIGEWYHVFDQTSDDEVRRLLDAAWARQAPGRASS